jgi:dihydroorotase
MPKKKAEKTIEIKKDVAPVSPSYEKFEALMNVYKNQNPEKYALKEARLKEKLASLK